MCGGAGPISIVFASDSVVCRAGLRIWRAKQNSNESSTNSNNDGVGEAADVRRPFVEPPRSV